MRNALFLFPVCTGIQEDDRVYLRYLELSSRAVPVPAGLNIGGRCTPSMLVLLPASLCTLAIAGLASQKLFTRSTNRGIYLLILLRFKMCTKDFFLIPTSHWLFALLYYTL